MTIRDAQRAYRAAHGDIRNSNYEAFILTVSVLSICNTVGVLALAGGEARRLLLIVNTGLCCLFAVDFAYRLWMTPSKGLYLFGGGGVLDLLSSVPLPWFGFARTLRVVRASRLLRQRGVQRLGTWFRERLAEGAVLMVLFLVLLVLEVGGLLVLRAETGAQTGNIKTAGDALWWGYVTMTTVGYGDRYPVTAMGRVVGVVMLTVGLGLFATVTGYVANTFLENARARKQGSRDDDAHHD